MAGFLHVPAAHQTVLSTQVRATSNRVCQKTFRELLTSPYSKRKITSVIPGDDSSTAAERRRNFTNHRMGGERMRPDDVPTHLQTIGWGWSSESIMHRNPEANISLFGDGPRIPQLATPPAWALEPGIPCQPQTHGFEGEKAVLHMNKWDAGYSTKDTERAYHLCEDCPVRSECLTSALTEEGKVGGQERYMIRGGLLPITRAQIAQNIDITGKVRA